MATRINCHDHHMDNSPDGKSGLLLVLVDVQTNLHQKSVEYGDSYLAQRLVCCAVQTENDAAPTKDTLTKKRMGCEMSIIMDLFDGSVYPYEQVVPHTEAYRKLRREIADLSQELQKELNSEEYGKVEHYRDMLSDSFHLEGVAYFGEGLRLGIGIMTELYGVSSKCETDGADDPGEK